MTVRVALLALLLATPTAFAHGPSPGSPAAPLAPSFERAERAWCLPLVGERCGPGSAVALAGRIFPGTAEWLQACSSATSEGGWGRWVPNRRGSGAGGWMQFKSRTFYGHVDRAFAAARRRGWTVPARYRSWYSRVGQAVTAAYMLLAGQRRQWAGRLC